MTDSHSSFIAQRLSTRMAECMHAIPPVEFADTEMPEGLLQYLGEHLAGGETHYTVRPGIPELRSAIGRELQRRGGPLREAEGVIVTHGEAEALFVTLLGFGLYAGTGIIVEGKCRHRQLLDRLRIEVLGTHDAAAESALACYREIVDEFDGTILPAHLNCPRIFALGGLLYSKGANDGVLKFLTEDSIMIGHLDSLPGLDHFRVGYVAGPPDVVKQIQTWKQALSICSAAPSQRAALFAIDKEGLP